MATTTVYSYLESKGWKPRKSAGELQIPCPFCGDTNKYGHLYINPEHGAYICFRCDERGSFYDFQVKLGDTPLKLESLLAEKQAVWADVVEISQDALLEAPHALDYLKRERGLTAQTIGQYRLGWAPHDLQDQLMAKWTKADLANAGLIGETGNILFWNRIIIPYYQLGHLTNLRAKQIHGGMLQVKDADLRLFGVDNLRGQREVWVCEGEFDAMFLTQQGFPACGLPGALNYQELWGQFFDEASRVFLVLDADDAGQKGAEKVKQHLGNRARIIELPVPEGEKSTDITEFFLRDDHTKDEFQELVDEARGQRVYSFLDGLREHEEILAQEGLKLGFPDLDYAIEPGLLPGQVVTVLARTGAGKTGFVTTICHNASGWRTYKGDEGGPGIPVLLLSLEQTKGEIANRLQRIAGLYNIYADASEINNWYSKMRVCDENRIPSGDVRAIVDEYIEDVGEPPRLLIVDYLGYWARGFKGSSKYEQTSDAVMELKRYAKELGVTIIAPHQVSRLSRGSQRIEMDFARDSGVVEETSDFVLSLFRTAVADDEEEPDVRRQADVRMEILKSRHGSVGRQVMMYWAPYSLALISRSDKRERAVLAEWHMQNNQMPYSEVVMFHKGMRGLDYE